MPQVIRRQPGGRPGDVLGFAVKVIGLGLLAGLMLTYCNVLLDACLRGLH
jgi:hypothetical protein